MSNEQCLEAVVEKLASGRRGGYAVCRADEREGTITFSLDDTEVWGEKTPPEEGEVVRLSDISKRVGGWRASKAERITR